MKETKAKRVLKRNVLLWNALQLYLKETKSTGCGYIDYACLYKTIRSMKPTEVLECGTGVSTLIIAHALMENEIETQKKGGRVTSMEENEGWLEMSRKFLPQKYAKWVDFRLSETIEDQYSIFRGVRYKDVPDRAYDFVFVDGPKYVSPVDSHATFNFDYLKVLRNSDKPVGCLIDKRLSTVFVFQQLPGINKVKYSIVNGLGYVKPCTRNDLGTIANSISSKNFRSSMRVVKNRRLFIATNK